MIELNKSNFKFLIIIIKQLFKNAFKETMILVLSNLMLNRYAYRKFCVWNLTLFRFFP